MTEPIRVPITDQERSLYVNAVWDEYQKFTGRERLVSNIEFCLIRHWLETGVPLRIVLRAFKDMGKTGRSLLYAELPVQRAMETWQKAMAGA